MDGKDKKLPKAEIKISKERLLELTLAIEEARKSGDEEKWIEAHNQFVKEALGVEGFEEGDND